MVTDFSFAVDPIAELADRSGLKCLNVLSMVGAGEDGGVILETAVSFALILGIIVGIIQVTLALYTYHFVTDAAREATRYAVVRGSYSCANTPGLSNCGATADEVSDYVKSFNFPGINPANLSVSTSWPDTGSTCYPSTSPCNNPGNTVLVQVTYQFPLNIPIWRSASLNLSSSSRMVISQ